MRRLLRSMAQFMCFNRGVHFVPCLKLVRPDVCYAGNMYTCPGAQERLEMAIATDSEHARVYTSPALSLRRLHARKAQHHSSDTLWP
jgi:predicted nucleotide-binding protein (sugar kinase/HSP70/actin superfamily)